MLPSGGQMVFCQWTVFTFGLFEDSRVQPDYELHCQAAGLSAPPLLELWCEMATNSEKYSCPLYISIKVKTVFRSIYKTLSI